MATVSESQLEQLFQRAHASHISEAEFYTRLMQAMVYVHVPVYDDCKNVRLIQFRHPSGFDVIPLFTSAERCARAGSNAVEALRLPCIDLLNATRGATLMINPNDGGPLLYPEEIAVLLEKGTLETFEKLDQAGSCDVRPAMNPPDNIVDALRAGATSTTFIKDVYLLEKREAGSDETMLFVYVGACTTHLERAARHMIQVLQNLSPPPQVAIDVAVYDTTQAPPEFLKHIGAVAMFVRTI